MSLGGLSKEGTIRPFQPGDEREVNDLFNRVFGKQRSLDEWKWKFGHHPDAMLEVMSVALVSERIVGMYPCIIGRWKVGSSTLTAVQPVETAIEEGMRGGTIIMKLQKAHVEGCERLGVSFAYGTPTEGHARLGKRRLGYIELSSLRLFRKHLNARLPWGRFLRGPLKTFYQNALTRRVGSRRGSGDGEGKRLVVQRESIDARFDELWQRLSPQYDVIAMRDARFLRWRYFERRAGSQRCCFTATLNGQLAGYLILVLKQKRSSRIGIVADIFAPTSGPVAGALLCHAESVCVAERVDYMQVAALPHMCLCKELHQFGFFTEPNTKSIVCVPFSSIDRSIFSDPSRWYFTLGDFDFDED
jgi:hypothetical protein